MTIPEFATGDDILIEADLTLNGVAPPSVVSVAGALILRDRSGRAAGTSDVVGQVIDTTADYVRVLLHFPKATTGSIVPGQYLVEIQVTDNSGYRRTYKPFPVQIENGVVA